MDNIIVGQRYKFYLTTGYILRGDVLRITDICLFLINVNTDQNKKTIWSISINTIKKYENLITIKKNKLILPNNILFGMNNIIVGQRYTIYLKSGHILRGNVFRITNIMLILINVDIEQNKETEWCITIDNLKKYENLITITKNKSIFPDNILFEIDTFL